MEGNESSITRLLSAARQGDTAAHERLMAQAYPRLKQIARTQLRKQNAGKQTLQPTELVSEAYLAMFGETERNWCDRAHFFAYAATVMRHILVHHCRRRSTVKRGGDLFRVSLNQVDGQPWRDPDLLELDAALTELAKIDARKSQFVELFYFGGLTAREIAAVEKFSEATVYNDLRAARGWLFHQLAIE